MEQNQAYATVVNPKTETELEEIHKAPTIAKTITVFMVHGLFTKLQFAYAQFPCSAQCKWGNAFYPILGSNKSSRKL